MKLTIDIGKFQKISSYNKIHDMTLADAEISRKQAIKEFDQYQRSAPNTFWINVNGSKDKILATFQDVSDLEVRADTKWVTTSLLYKLNQGDIITWDGKPWMVVYDKKKNTGNCYKCKVQPCTYPVKIAMKDDFNKPYIYTADSIAMSYLSDIQYLKQPFPTEIGTMFISVQFNKILSSIEEEFRIWIFDKPYKITGIDYTNIDHYTNHGFIKWTCRPELPSEFDNSELMVCDYYKFFEKPQDVKPPVQNDFNVIVSSYSISINSYCRLSVDISDEVVYEFVGDTCKCTLEQNGHEALLKSKREYGYVKIKIYKKNDQSKSVIKKIIIDAMLKGSD